MIDILPLAWAGIIAFGIVLYVILDGFTLGTGMLLPLFDANERDLAMSVLLPTWDGNQTWLVLGGACLYGAFPMAFSLLMPLLYLPLLVMVVALLLRGVVFEFRLKATTDRPYWDKIFVISSALVTLVQGLILGNFVEGFEISTSPYIISDKAIITPFGLFASLGLVLGYILLGATRLIYKTEGELQAKAKRVAWWSAFAIIFSIVVVSIWTPFVNPHVFDRWFGHKNWLYLSILPYISGLTFLVLIYALKKGEEHIPFYCSVVLFLCPYLGFIISIYPYIVPYRITIFEAAAPDSSLYFLLVGAIIMIPLLLIYTGYAYQIFKGKVKNVFHY